jgi:hypothetical protein
MRNGKLLAVVGIVAGAVGILGAALLFRKFRSVKVVADAEDRLVEEVMRVALPKRIKPKSKKGKKVSVLTKQKLGKAGEVLRKMKAGNSYTQIELEQLTKIPYRSIRRYVEVLHKEGKIITEGYGKGKKFSKK